MMFIIKRLPILALISFMLFGGCDVLEQNAPTQSQFDAFLNRVDSIAEKIPVIIENTETLMESPAAKLLIPASVKAGVGVGLISLSSIATWYLNARKNHFKNSTARLHMIKQIFLQESETGNAEMLSAELHADDILAKKL